MQPAVNPAGEHSPIKARSFADRMEAKLDGFLERIEASEPYRRVFDPDADPRLVLSVVKYVLLEVFSYGPHVTEATFTAIGRMPKTRPDLMKVMVRHDLEEVDHGEMALVDFVRLGGNEHWARERKITPASFAMAATVRMLAERESPFAYLGYMYPFEALTPVLTARLQEQLGRKGFPVAARRFIDVHAEEDVCHAKVLGQLIGLVAQEFEEAAKAVEYGFDCFIAVYPLPIWDAALGHALAELGA
jgi:hypothetical protein